MRSFRAQEKTEEERRKGGVGDQVQMGQEGSAEEQSTGQAGFLGTQPARMEAMLDHMQLH